MAKDSAVAEYGDQAEPQPVLSVVPLQPHPGGVGGDLADQRGEKLPVPPGEIVGRCCSAMRSTSVCTTGGNEKGTLLTRLLATRPATCGRLRTTGVQFTLDMDDYDRS
jgi:hypothetical protein